jgi:uncharacterized protein (TIGR02596 family)
MQASRPSPIPFSPSSAFHRRPSRARAAFTLIEVLMVLGIITIIITVTVPALSNISAATQLTQAGDLVLGHLSEAQQRAIATDSEVEVRIYEDRDPGEADAPLKLRSLQTFVLQPADFDGSTGPTTALEATFHPITSIVPLSSGIILSSKEKLNSLLSRGYTTPAPTNTDDESATPELRYLSIRFLPDGSTNLPPGPTTPWFFTLVDAASEDSTEATMVPPNFYALQIDAVTGRLRTFRP